MKQPCRTDVLPGRCKRDKGAWENPPVNVDAKWAELEAGYQWLTQKYPRFLNTNNYKHLGTLGTGNHFIEICLDESDQVWIMLHSGSRGIGNAIGTYFIDLAQKESRTNLRRCRRVIWRTLWKVRNTLMIT